MKKSKNTMEIYESGNYYIYLETQNTGKYPCYSYYISRKGSGIITHCIGYLKEDTTKENFIELIKSELKKDKAFYEHDLEIIEAAFCNAL